MDEEGSEEGHSEPGNGFQWVELALGNGELSERREADSRQNAHYFGILDAGKADSLDLQGLYLGMVLLEVLPKRLI